MTGVTGPPRSQGAGPVLSMGTPRLPNKRWSIDLEKKIQEEHYADEGAYQTRYGFKPESGKPIFVHRHILQGHGTSEPLHNIR